jgi:hypothetical protein
LQLSALNNADCPFERKGRQERWAMLKPLQKPTRRPLVHHPSDVLDTFCRFDDANSPWREFSDKLSGQLAQFEADHPEYIRLREAATRRMSK